MHRTRLTFWLLTAGALILVQRSFSQVDSGETVPEVTRTYALENARVIQAPGRVLERATVVVRDGLIVEVAPDAAIPFDAELIAADSLVIYAGFIDGLSHAGIPEPKEEPDRDRPDDPGNPPDGEAGIQPERDVRSLLNASDNRLQELRSVGFTAAHVVPRGRMLPGTGAVILLSEGGPHDLVVKGEASTLVQFSPARRMYPGTDMAILAKMRQLYQEAERRQRIERLYGEDPSGIARPRYDPVHYAFFPVITGERPVYVLTEDVLDLHRALALQQELGFSAVLAGLEESFAAVDRLKEAGHPLLLTLSLPKKPGEGKQPEEVAATRTTDAPPDLPSVAEEDYLASFRTRSYLDVEAEKKNLEARRQRAYEQYVGNAAELHHAGLSFGFTSIGTKPGEIAKNLRAMIERGLPEDVALAALTTEPADILGLSAVMGTVDTGKMANLVVSHGPIFEEESQLRYVFVDGRKFEIESAAADSVSAVASAAGTWSFVVSSPDGDVHGTMTLTEIGGNWSGSLTHELSDASATLDSLVVDSAEVSFSFEESDLGTVGVQLTVSGNQADGEVSIPAFGTLPITGNRDPQQ